MKLNLPCNYPGPCKETGMHFHEQSETWTCYCNVFNDLRDNSRASRNHYRWKQQMSPCFTPRLGGHHG